MKLLTKILLLFTALVTASCVTVSKKPDLDLIYRSSYLNENATPIIIIPGLMGTTLVNAKGEEIWPKSVSNLAFSRFDELIEGNAEQVMPGQLFDAMAGIDFYGTLLSTLEKAGRYEKSVPGTPVVNKSKRRYYVLLYDWRRSNFEAINQLHALVEQVRKDYKDPSLKFDIIAHSNGGLIARYYLQYGPQTEKSREQPETWSQGDQRIRRIAMLGTPNLGSINSVNRLYHGFKIGLRTIPTQVLANFATPYETLPNPKSKMFIDNNGTAIPLDIYDLSIWQNNKWSIFSDEVKQQVSKEQSDPEQAMARLSTRFAQNLKQAKYFQTALGVPLKQSKTEIALFGGDCNLTASRAIIEGSPGTQHLAFEESQLKSPQKNVDYKNLLLAPGDGLVTRESQLARASNIYLNDDLPEDLFPISQTTFFCESHESLTANSYFQNNLLYFIFH